MRAKRRCITAVVAFGVIFCGAVFAQEGIARISDFSGEVAIRRGEQTILPAKTGAMIRNALLAERDMVQTRKGTASVLFEDGSMLKMKEDTLVVISPPTEQVKTVAAGLEAERRIRIVVGRLWTYVKPEVTAKTVFELPDGVCAVRGCSGDFVVGWNGNYRVTVAEGTYIPRDSRVDVGWEQDAGVDVGVERVSGGIRVRNLEGSRGPIALNFSRRGQFDIEAEKGGLDLIDADGRARSLQEGQRGLFTLFGTPVRELRPGGSVLIVLRTRGPRPVGQLASLAPFPHQTMQDGQWRFAASHGGRAGGDAFAQPEYVRDERRSAQLGNTRAQRTVFNRESGRAPTHEGAAKPVEQTIDRRRITTKD